ncbi:MAG: V-type ATPase 116kDa subunit family protein [Deltaproteobacteria bacterium]|nr:V-type ATPase 116kDa subunit family protein [Deltaproteobacteria bacterium]
MIVPMSRIYVVIRKGDQDRLLKKMGEMGLLHVEAVNPHEAMPDEAILQDISDLDRAIQILAPIPPPADGEKVDQAPMETVLEVIETHADMREKQARLKELYRETEQLTLWGDVRISDLRALQEAGVETRFFSVPQAQMDQLAAECVEIVDVLADDHLLVAVVDRTGSLNLPEGVKPIQLPPRDRPSIRTEASRIDSDIKKGAERLALLATQKEILKNEREKLSANMAYEVTERSGLLMADLFAIQGWMPTEKAKRVASRLWDHQIPAGVRIRDAQEGELPPTLIRYPTWTRPIKGLFDLLGTLPGYREVDLSPFFMIALPLFAAMLIGDAGYGCLLALAGVCFYRKIAQAGGREKAQLLIIFGIVTFVWGVLTANYFGITPETLAQAAGFVTVAAGGVSEVNYSALWSSDGVYARAAQFMRAAAPLWRPESRGVPLPHYQGVPHHRMPASGDGPFPTVFGPVSRSAGLCGSRLDGGAGGYPDIDLASRFHWC